MIIEACSCSWDIAGIEKLPAHTHDRRMLIEWRDNKGSHQIWMQGSGDLDHWIRMYPENQNRVLEQVDEINIWVDWKEYARGLSKICTGQNG